MLKTTDSSDIHPRMSRALFALDYQGDPQLSTATSFEPIPNQRAQLNSVVDQYAGLKKETV